MLTLIWYSIPPKKNQKTKFSICKFQKIYIQQKRDLKKKLVLGFCIFFKHKKNFIENTEFVLLWVI